MSKKTAILGLQWGDEGKGKIIDYLSGDYQVVARFQGGNNAGHTIVIQGKTYKLNHIPSGILHENTVAFLGSGMVIALDALFSEINQLRASGIEITEKNLKIADNATLILPLYKEVDALLEQAKGEHKIGTTHKGIGIAYQDKVARRALRVADVFEKESFLRPRVEEIIRFYTPLFLENQRQPPLVEDIFQFLNQYRTLLLPHLVNAYSYFAEHGHKAVLFEGAQGLMLDVNWGTYPFVTSSNTHASEVFLGTGLGYRALDQVIGVMKAYTTRVGSGPFFTEDSAHLGGFLQEKGKELGTVTGRKRRCGALDLVAVRYGARLSGVTKIALTKLDVLDDLEQIPVCIGYELNGKEIDYLPTLPSEQELLKPLYKYFKGWKTDTSKAQTWDELPALAREYCTFVEEFLAIKIGIVSVGPGREQTIFTQR